MNCQSTIVINNINTIQNKKCFSKSAEKEHSIICGRCRKSYQSLQEFFWHQWTDSCDKDKFKLSSKLCGPQLEHNYALDAVDIFRNTLISSIIKDKQLCNQASKAIIIRNEKFYRLKSGAKMEAHIDSPDKHESVRRHNIGLEHNYALDPIEIFKHRKVASFIKGKQHTCDIKNNQELSKKCETRINTKNKLGPVNKIRWKKDVLKKRNICKQVKRLAHPVRCPYRCRFCRFFCKTPESLQKHTATVHFLDCKVRQRDSSCRYHSKSRANDLHSIFDNIVIKKCHCNKCIESLKRTNIDLLQPTEYKELFLTRQCQVELKRCTSSSSFIKKQDYFGSSIRGR